MTPSVLSFRQMKSMRIAPGLMCRASLIRMCAPSRSVNSGELRCDVRPQARRDVRPDFNWNRKQVGRDGPSVGFAIRLHARYGLVERFL